MFFLGFSVQPSAFMLLLWKLKPSFLCAQTSPTWRRARQVVCDVSSRSNMKIPPCLALCAPIKVRRERRDLLTRFIEQTKETAGRSQAHEGGGTCAVDLSIWSTKAGENSGDQPCSPPWGEGVPPSLVIRWQIEDSRDRGGNWTTRKTAGGECHVQHGGGGWSKTVGDDV